MLYGDLKMIRARGSQAFHGSGATPLELYDLSRDPQEQQNLARAEGLDPRGEVLTRVLDAWRRELAQRTGPAARTATEKLDPETRKQLEGLGYLDPE